MSTPTSVSNKKAQAILALGQKSFFLRPCCLDHYLRQLDLTEIAREVFWYHWGIGYRDRTITTHLSINQVAAYLGISSSSVSRAYEQLSTAELIVRLVPPADHGGYGVAETTITLPDAVLTTLLAEQPDRHAQTHKRVDTTLDRVSCDPVIRKNRTDLVDTKIPSLPAHEPHPVKSRADQRETGVSAEAIQDRIEELDQAIQHWNDRAVHCSKQKEVSAYRQAVANAEQSQRQRDQLRRQLTEMNDPQQAPARQLASRDPSPDQQDRSTHQGLTTETLKPPARSSAPSAQRQLHPTIKTDIARLVKAMPRVSNPPEVTQEVIFSIEQGAQKMRPIPWAIRSALALIRDNRWRTPYGFGGAPKLGEGVQSN